MTRRSDSREQRTWGSTKCATCGAAIHSRSCRRLRNAAFGATLSSFGISRRSCVS